MLRYHWGKTAIIDEDLGEHMNQVEGLIALLAVLYSYNVEGDISGKLLSRSPKLVS